MLQSYKQVIHVGDAFGNLILSSGKDQVLANMWYVLCIALTCGRDSATRDIIYHMSKQDRGRVEAVVQGLIELLINHPEVDQKLPHGTALDGYTD